MKNVVSWDIKPQVKLFHCRNTQSLTEHVFVKIRSFTVCFGLDGHHQVCQV
jgi:hypothetical protein